MTTELKIGGIYHHYKHPDKHYRLIGVGKNTETLEPCVIYQPLYESGADYWVRPYDMFVGTVEKDGKTFPRFALVRES